MVKKILTRVKRRYPVVDGIFYPENREAVIHQLESWGLTEGTESKVLGGRAVIVPHAAWNLAGSLAGAAFAALQQGGKGSVFGVSRVILIGPCHQSADEGIFLTESASFVTPLGNLPVDMELNSALASCSTLFTINDIPHLSEHSLEVILPLVKYCFPYAEIVPIIVNGVKPAFVSALAAALRIVFERYMKDSLFVVSSHAARNIDPYFAFAMAEEFRLLLEKMDADALLEALARGRISACGAALAGALLKSGLFAGKSCTSLSPITQGKGENGETVCYGSFIIR